MAQLIGSAGSVAAPAPEQQWNYVSDELIHLISWSWSRSAWLLDGRWWRCVWMMGLFTCMTMLMLWWLTMWEQIGQWLCCAVRLAGLVVGWLAPAAAAAQKRGKVVTMVVLVVGSKSVGNGEKYFVVTITIFCVKITFFLWAVTKLFCREHNMVASPVTEEPSVQLSFLSVQGRLLRMWCYLVSPQF